MIAEAYLFVREQGNNHGRWIDFFNQSVSTAAGQPWCLSFLDSCLIQNLEEYGFNHSLALSEHVMTFFRANVAGYETAPRPGLIMTWNHVGSDRGHAGLITKVIDEHHVETVEGNTSPSVATVDREGDGVYKKTRPLVQLGDMKPNLYFINPYWKGAK